MKKYLIFASFLPALMGVACPPPVDTDGLDLGVRGHVYLEISRDSGKASADVTASVLDGGAGLLVLQLLELSPMQVLSVSGVPLSHGFLDFPSWVSATIPALTPPDTYSISFDNNGEVQQMRATAVNETLIVAPPADSGVSKSGFVVDWTPFGEHGVLVDIEIAGQVPDPERPGSTKISYKSLDDRADTGSLAIEPDSLADFLPGTVEVTNSRHRSTPQALGFASGSVVVKSTDTRRLLLTD